MITVKGIDMMDMESKIKEKETEGYKVFGVYYKADGLFCMEMSC